MLLQNMRLAFRAALIDLKAKENELTKRAADWCYHQASKHPTPDYTYIAAVLTKIVLGRFQDWQVQLRYGFRCNIGMSFGQVVHQHSPSLKTEDTLVAFVDVPMKVQG